MGLDWLDLDVGIRKFDEDVPDGVKFIFLLLNERCECRVVSDLL